MSIFFTKKSNAAKTNDSNPPKSLPSLDRPSFRGFAQILKAPGNEVTDKALRAFAGNSAFSTRMRGAKLW